MKLKSIETLYLNKRNENIKKTKYVQIRQYPKSHQLEIENVCM